MIVVMYCRASGCECCAFFYESRSYVSAGNSDLGSDIRDTKYLQGGRPTTSMKKGWFCRTSYDKKNQEIAPVMMTQ